MRRDHLKILTRMLRTGQQDRVELAARLGDPVANSLLGTNYKGKDWEPVHEEMLKDTLTLDEMKELWDSLTPFHNPVTFSSDFVINFWLNISCVNERIWKDKAIKVLTRHE